MNVCVSHTNLQLRDTYEFRFICWYKTRKAGPCNI